MPLQLEDKMISIFKRVIPGKVLPEELQQELIEQEPDDENNKDFKIEQRGGILNSLKNYKTMASNLLIVVDQVLDLVEKLRKLIYWEDQKASTITLVVLLLAFFVVMYSVSSLNSGKYRVMSEALMAAFRGEPQRDMPIGTARMATLTSPAGLRIDLLERR